MKRRIGGYGMEVSSGGEHDELDEESDGEFGMSSCSIACKNVISYIKPRDFSSSTLLT